MEKLKYIRTYFNATTSTIGLDDLTESQVDSIYAKLHNINEANDFPRAEVQLLKGDSISVHFHLSYSINN